ncbi:MAG: hypothetical protein QE493_00910, partial [Verrucomicrobiae bacterium]|nr:hypothetical protein [Verrucomicrobiae bacterium]
AETSTISEIMEVILGIVVASGGIGEYNLHSRASERVSPHLHPDPVRTNSSSNPLNNNHETQGSFEGHTVTPVTQEGDKPLYRRMATGWEKRSPSAAGGTSEGEDQWEETDRFDNPDPGRTWREALTGESGNFFLDKNIDHIVIQNFSRIDGITKKIESYQQRLDSPETSQAEREKFTNLISVLEPARNYQTSIIDHLGDSPISPVSRISVAMKHDERPNKIELIAEQLEKDYSQLETYQERVQALQSEIEIAQQVAAAIEDGEQIRENIIRLRSRGHLLDAITHQSKLIEARVASGRLLRPPHETLSGEQQAVFLANKWLCIREDALAQSASIHQQYSEAEAAGQHYKAVFLDRAGDALLKAAEEAQKPNPNQQSIDLFTQSSGFHQQAAEAEAAGQIYKAVFLDRAGAALFIAAEEAQNPNPNQQSIDWFAQSLGYRSHQAFLTSLQRQ